MLINYRLTNLSFRKTHSIKQLIFKIYLTTREAA